MRHPNLYWMQALPASFLLCIIGPIFLPEWLAFGAVITIGLTATVTSAAAMVIDAIRSPLPLAGAVEAVGILVGMFISFIGIHMLFGKKGTDFFYSFFTFIAENPNQCVVLVGLLVAVVLSLGQANE